MKKAYLSTKDICLISIFTAIICVFALIRIPMPYGVPMTLQTFIIPLAGILLGAKKGTLATIIYILLGALGLPFFSGFTGGIGVILGPTGGFILSFPIMALAAGIASEKGTNAWIILGLIAGAIFNFLCGMAVFSIITSNDISTAFAACVLPFIPTTIVKIALCSILGIKLRSVFIKTSLFT